ncbi:MAG TPA: hypothetical protein VJ761_08490 [Ktedonobacteraceae bacterium]|nr:hypothetical protein [Ktedonobacteraceae bacterium]
MPGTESRQNESPPCLLLMSMGLHGGNRTPPLILLLVVIGLLLRGEIEAATLLDPEIAIAEARGLRALARGEFLITFWVAPTVTQEVLGAYFRALKRADEALSRDPQLYLPLWERNVPPALAGPYDYSTFGLGEKFVFEPYTQEMFGQALGFAERWNLHTHVQERRYDRLIMPVGI